MLQIQRFINKVILTLLWLDREILIKKIDNKFNREEQAHLVKENNV